MEPSRHAPSTNRKRPYMATKTFKECLSTLKWFSKNQFTRTLIATDIASRRLSARHQFMNCQSRVIWHRLAGVTGYGEGRAHSCDLGRMSIILKRYSERIGKKNPCSRRANFRNQRSAKIQNTQTYRSASTLEEERKSNSS